MTGMETSTTPDCRTEPPAGRDRPDRFLAAALRLIACPCSAPLHDTLRPDSAAAALLDLIRVIDHHARRPLLLYRPTRPDLSADETAVIGLIACLQTGREREAVLRCRTLVRPAGQRAMLAAADTVARRLTGDAIALPAPAIGSPSPVGPWPPLQLVAAG